MNPESHNFFGGLRWPKHRRKNTLEQTFEEEEILNNINFVLHPGPDGFSMAFYQVSEYYQAGYFGYPKIAFTVIGTS